MRRRRGFNRGDGSAWLVVDRRDATYLGYWYAGRFDAQLVEQIRTATAADAVAWARDRTPRVRIRMADARTYWAGIGSRPTRFTNSWVDAGARISG